MTDLERSTFYTKSRPIWTKLVSNLLPSEAVLQANVLAQYHVNCSGRRDFCAKWTFMKLDTVRKPISLGAHYFRTADLKTIRSSSFDSSWRALYLLSMNVASRTHVSMKTSAEAQIMENIDVIDKYCEPGIVYVDEPISTGIYTITSADTKNCACHFAVQSAYTWAEYCCPGLQVFEVHGKFVLWKPLYKSVVTDRLSSNFPKTFLGHPQCAKSPLQLEPLNCFFSVSNQTPYFPQFPHVGGF